MFFTIKNKYNLDKETLIASTLLSARDLILIYPNRVNERKWNEYLIEKYNKPLKIVCLELLNNLKLDRNYNNQLILTFKSKKLEELASLITYGNGVIQGSKILKEALSN